LSDSDLTSTYPLKVTITNSAPYFLPDKVPPTDLTLHLNDLYLFDLHYTDLETPTQVLVSIQQTTVMRTFIALSDDWKTLTINPVASNALGTHTLTVVLSDSNLVKEYKISLKIVNTLPRFFKEDPVD
jgi:hypothetical protein